MFYDKQSFFFFCRKTKMWTTCVSCGKRRVSNSHLSGSGLHSEAGYIGCPVALCLSEIYWHIFFVLNIFNGVKRGCHWKQMHIFLFTHSQVGDVREKENLCRLHHAWRGTFPRKYYLNLDLVAALKLQHSDWIPLWSHGSHNGNPRSYIAIQCLKYDCCCWYKILHVRIFQGFTARRFTTYDSSAGGLKSARFISVRLVCPVE